MGKGVEYCNLLLARQKTSFFFKSQLTSSSPTPDKKKVVDQISTGQQKKIGSIHILVWLHHRCS
jgi:hypothetical protein